VLLHEDGPQLLGSTLNGLASLRWAIRLVAGNAPAALTFLLFALCAWIIGILVQAY
jgi:hypothetical protein